MSHQTTTVTTLQVIDAQDEGAGRGDVGGLLQKKQPNFDARNFGFQKLTPFIKSIKQLEIEERENPKGRSKLMYVRIRE